jgi:hypothetical protein
VPHPLPPHHGGVHPGVPVHHVQPGHVVHHTQPSHWTNATFHHSFHHSYYWNHGFEHRHPAWTPRLDAWRHDWHSRFWPACNYRWGIYRHFWFDYYRFYYSDWFRWGFYGGFWYPVRPWVDIEVYFVYPMVYWFYQDQFDPAYFVEYYEPVVPPYVPPGEDPVPAPDPTTCDVSQFPYAGVYFASDTLRDLLVEASGFPGQLRCTFMKSITLMTDQLRSQIGAQFQQQDFAFDANDVVINHYENLQNQAITLAGFVDHGGLHIAFQGMLDLVDPTQTSVLVPQGQSPTGDEINRLQSINDRVKSLGGDPYSAAEEPTTAPPAPPH